MKRLLPFAAVIALLAAASYITAPAVLSKERVKRAVTQELSARAGRPVTFSGEPTVTLFPYLGFRLDKVVVANAPGLGAEPFAVMESLRGSIKLLPLFFGRVEPGHVHLIAPRIYLTVDAGGRVNWDSGGRMAGAPLDRQVAFAVRRSGQRALGRLTITDGFVTYANAESGASSELSAVNLSLSWRSPTEQAFASGTMVWRGETVEVSGSLARPLDFFAGRNSPASFTVRATPLRLSFQGSAYAGSEMGLDGEIRVATPSLRRTLAWAGRGIGDGPTLGAASVAAKAKIAGSSITLADAAIELDGNEASGGISIALDGDRPRFQGTLAFETLDVSPYLESFRAGLAGSSDWDPVAINLPVLRDTDLDFRLSAQQVVVGGAKFGSAAASAVGTGGRVSIDIGEFQIYGGNLQATLTADLTDPVVTATARASLSNVPTKATLANLAGISAIDATGSAVVEISGRAASWNALLRSAAGSASFSLVNCSITGIDISQFRDESPDETGGSVTTPTPVTTFESIAGTLSLSDGVVRTDDLAAEGPEYAVRLDGSASLLQPTIRGRGTITIRAADEPAGKAGPLAVPFLIGGSWLRPMISPDIDRILLRKEAKPAAHISRPAAVTVRVP